MNTKTTRRPTDRFKLAVVAAAASLVLRAEAAPQSHSAAIRLQLGQQFFAEGRYPDAFDAYQKALEIAAPDDVRAARSGVIQAALRVAEFDVAREEGGLYILTMHPHIVGHRARAAMLERLILHMKARPGTWFATHEQIARYVKDEAGLR